MDYENYQKLTEGEQLLVDWQCSVCGSFIKSLFACLSNADDNNLLLLEKAYPEVVKAFRKYKFEKGWWEEITTLLKIDGEQNGKKS